MTHKYISRRRFITGAAALTAGAVTGSSILSGMSWASSTNVLKKSKKLTIGYIPILDCVPLIVGYHKGFFKEAGLRVKKPILIRAWPALMEAFTSKNILLTHILLPQVIFMRYKQNVDIRSIAFNHTNVVAMLTGKNIKSVRELGGKIVGCPTWWAPHTGIFQDVIREVGLTPVVGKKNPAKHEVAFRVVPPPDMVEGLKTGFIGACTVSEPFGAGAEILADATMIKMSGDVWKNHPCCQSTLLQRTIDQDPPWARAVTESIYRSALWARNNKEELAEILGKDGGGYFPMPVKVIKRALLKNDLETYGHHGTGAIMHDHWDVKRVDFIPYPYESAFDVTLDMMRGMTVDQSAALPDALRELSGAKVANDVVDYNLVEFGMKAVGGHEAFDLAHTEDKRRQEQYEVLVKE